MKPGPITEANRRKAASSVVFLVDREKRRGRALYSSTADVNMPRDRLAVMCPSRQGDTVTSIQSTSFRVPPS